MNDDVTRQNGAVEHENRNEGSDQCHPVESPGTDESWTPSRSLSPGDALETSNVLRIVGQQLPVPNGRDVGRSSR